MSVNRHSFTPAERRFFTAFDRSEGAGGPSALARGWMTPEEIAAKRAAHRDMLEQGWKTACKPIDYKENWDKTGWATATRIQAASLYYRFTGDRRAIRPALDGLAALEACKRPYWTFSSCIGVLDMDLLTATCVHSLGLMKACMGDALDPAAHRRLKRQAVDRILVPGLEAERRKTYPWMKSKANWRIILPGCFAMAAMAFADDCPAHRALIEYGIAGVLTSLATGDRAGGWNEGPGYWDYGLGYAVLFAFHLQAFTAGAVDLFRHPFLRKTGDFYLLMHTKRNEIWNWSDAGKRVGPSLALTGLARAQRNPAWQWLALAQGVKSLQQLWLLDPGLKPEPPPAGRPVSRLFPGLGVLVWRGGFGPRDSYIGVKAGDIPHFNHHCHMDFGNVVVHAEGRELLAETDKWTYPYEGRKDPTVKGAQPGFYDLAHKRWMRWDFDYVAALGHNMVTLEGVYPQPVIGAQARFLATGAAPGFAYAVVDGTPVYRPLARRVRRYVVLVRPDVLLLVDEIRAPKPVRARVHFQPGGKPDWGGDAFTIRNGPAELRGQSLHPAARDHLVMGLDDRTTTYLPPAGLEERRLRYLYIENLYRKKRLVFVTALQFGKKGFRPASFALLGAPAADDVFAVQVKRGRRSVQVRFDLSVVSVTVRESGKERS